MNLSCPYFERNSCRSCSLLELSLEEISLHKINALVEIVSQKAELSSEVIKPLVSPGQIFPSRAKAKLSVSGSVDRPIIGLIDLDYQGRELLNCPLHFPVLNTIAERICQLITKFKLTPYSIVERTGELKALLLTCNSDQTEVMVRFVLRSRSLLKQLESVAAELQSAFSTVIKAKVVVSANIQPKPAAILEGPEEIYFTELQQISQRYNDLTFLFSAQSFMQVTPSVAERLYRFVAEQVAQRGAKHVGEIYCGVGGFALSAARSAKSVAGMELSSSAIQNARAAATLNGIENTTFVAGDATTFFDSFAETRFDLMVLNPPRRGVAAEVLEQITERNIETVIISSCNPESLVRDIQGLGSRYRSVSLSPFDMFPLTPHLEVVAVLERTG